MRPTSFECDEGFFTLLSRSIVPRTCEISLPQKTSPACGRLRLILLGAKKTEWKLKTSPWGFERLNVSNPITFASLALADPFRRFNFEEYLQTLILNDPSKILSNKLFQSFDGKNGKALSNFLKLATDLGGVSMNYYFYAHFYFKRINLDNKGKRQA